MSISSIVQIANRLLNGDSGQDPQGQGKNKIAQTGSAQNNRTEFGDRFTPSGQGEAASAAGGAGLFQLEQLRFTAVNIQAAAGNAATGAAPTPANAVAQPQPAVTGNPAAATTTAPATPAATTPATPVATTTSPVQTQQDLQALNASLTSLGLNAAEIAAFDQFAGVLLQFDPNALQDLQSQLNLLAARFQTQNAAPAASTAAAAPAANAQTAAASPNFQLTELSVSFTGLKETLTQGNQSNGTGTTTQISAFNLQIQEVRVTLSNAAGETARLQVPQAAAPAATAAAPAAKSAGA